MKADAANPIERLSYRELPQGFFAEATPTTWAAPALVELNTALLASYGIADTWFRSDTALQTLAGSRFDTRNPPSALAYAGHQFGHFVPLLGDGRALMLGQLQTADGRWIDVQLKGSGRTRYSRGGDGRATLGSVLREYLVSEAMAGLGIPTTRSLAVLTTGEMVTRESPRPGAVVARTASSHIRVGTFQHAAANLGPDAVRALADHVIAQHFEALTDAPDRYNRLLESVISSQAYLVAQWMLVGFIHGVMNTDNMSVVGETIDYGPCAFMDEFHPAKVFSSIDRHGRYAWNQQAAIAHWNLTRLAETLLSLLDPVEDRAIERAQQSLGTFAPQFSAALADGFRTKLGFAVHSETAARLSEATLQLLAQHSLDYTLFFDSLSNAVAHGTDQEFVDQLMQADPVAAADPDALRAALSSWLDDWRLLRAAAPLDAAAMRRANPALIARNHRVEQAIAAAERDSDFAPFRRLAGALRNPYEIAVADRELLVPPQPAERVRETFCGT